jgi:hypothetical protein
MKDCHNARELYSLVQEKEASRQDERFFDAHMAACAACRTEFADFRATRTLLGELPRIDVSSGFDDRVLSLVRAAVRDARPVPPLPEPDRAPAFWEGWMPRFAVLGAAAALVAFVSLSTIRTAIDGGDVARRADEAPAASASAEPIIQTLGDRFPDLPPELLRALNEESYVLDHMTVRPATASGNARVVAPVDYDAGGTVYVTF